MRSDGASWHCPKHLELTPSLLFGARPGGIRAIDAPIDALDNSGDRFLVEHNTAKPYGWIRYSKLSKVSHLVETRGAANTFRKDACGFAEELARSKSPYFRIIEELFYPIQVGFGSALSSESWKKATNPDGSVCGE